MIKFYKLKEILFVIMIKTMVIKYLLFILTLKSKFIFQKFSIRKL